MNVGPLPRMVVAAHGNAAVLAAVAAAISEQRHAIIPLQRSAGAVMAESVARWKRVRKQIAMDSRKLA